jgi:hypothetical protein
VGAKVLHHLIAPPSFIFSIVLTTCWYQSIWIFQKQILLGLNIGVPLRLEPMVPSANLKCHGVGLNDGFGYIWIKKIYNS